MTLAAADHYPTQRYVVEVARKNARMKFWDTALDYGIDGTRVSLAILKIMCETVLADRKCHVDTC